MLSFLFSWEVWEEHRLFADEEEATLFLGALDTIFLFSYAIVSNQLLISLY
jgi:hypothetical protein